MRGLPCDADSGPNSQQNFPVLSSVTPGAEDHMVARGIAAAETPEKLPELLQAAEPPLPGTPATVREVPSLHDAPRILAIARAWRCQSRVSVSSCRRPGSVIR